MWKCRSVSSMKAWPVSGLNRTLISRLLAQDKARMVWPPMFYNYTFIRVLTHSIAYTQSNMNARNCKQEYFLLNLFKDEF